MKKIILFMLLIIFFVVLLSLNVFGDVKELSHSVKVVENSDECLVDCYTIYEVCAISKDVSVTFEFDKKIEDFEKVKAGFYKKQDSKKSFLKKNVDYKNYDVKNSFIKKGTCENITITAKKFPNEIIDNIPIIDGIEHTEFIYWNMSWIYKFPLNYSTNIYENNTIGRFAINDTAHFDFFDTINLNDLRLTWENDTTAIELKTFKWVNSPSAVIYFNTINYSNGNYYMYYNNPTAPNNDDPNGLFYFYDNANDSVGVNTSKWTNVGTTDEGTYFRIYTTGIFGTTIKTAQINLTNYPALSDKTILITKIMSSTGSPGGADYYFIKTGFESTGIAEYSSTYQQTPPADSWFESINGNNKATSAGSMTGHKEYISNFNNLTKIYQNNVLLYNTSSITGTRIPYYYGNVRDNGANPDPYVLLIWYWTAYGKYSGLELYYLLNEYDITTTQNSDVVETSSQNYTLTIHRNALTNSTWNLTMNGTATLLFSFDNSTLNATIFSATINEITFLTSRTLPSVTNNTFTNLTWTYNLTIPELNGQIIANQTIYNIDAGTCAGENIYPILNLTYYDEKTKNAINTTSNYNFFLTDGTNNLNTYANFRDHYSDTICTSVPPTLTYNWDLWGSITMTKTNYVTRIFVINEDFPLLVSNNPMTTLPLYLILANESSTISYTWYTTNFEAIDGTMQIYKCNPDNTKSLVESVPITASSAVANIELLYQPYSYKVIYEGVLYENNASYSSCHIESSTTAIYYIDVEGTDLSPFYGLNEINCLLYKTSNTTVRMNWTSNPNEPTTYVQGCIIAYRLTSSGNIEVYNNCSVETDGYSREVAIPLSTYTYIITGILKQGIYQVVCDENVVFHTSDNDASMFGNSGVFAIFLLIASMIFLFAGNGVIQLIGAIIALIVAFILGITTFPITTIIAIIIFCIVIIFVSKSNREA
jgi:hypothetical protein